MSALVVEENPDLSEREPAGLGAFQDRDTIEDTVVISTLPKGSNRFGEQSGAFIKSNRRRPQSGSFRDLANRHPISNSIA